MKGLLKMKFIMSMILTCMLYIGEAHALNTNSTGYRLVSGVGYTTIAAHGICKQVRNASGPDIFVPTRSASEWSLFLAAHPTGEKMDCVHTWQQSGFGSCDASCGPGNRHQTVSCQRHNGDIVSDSWCAMSGPKPATTQSCNLGACILPENGSCGTAGGSSFSSVPTSGLCDTGNPTAVTGFGPWGWSCLGTGSGSDMGCSAYVTAIPIPGVCDTVSKNSCLSGTFSDTADATNSWNWSCNGSPSASCAKSCTPNGTLIANDVWSGSIPAGAAAWAAQCCAGGFSTVKELSQPDNWDIYCGSSSVPSNCTPGTQNGYNHGSITHGNTQGVNKSINGTPANGKTDYTATANCNNGSITITGETPAVSCNSGYTWDGSSCTAAPVKCYYAAMTTPGENVGTPWSYTGSKKCYSNDRWYMEANTDCSTGTAKIPYTDGNKFGYRCVYTNEWGDWWGYISCVEKSCY